MSRDLTPTVPTFGALQRFYAPTLAIVKHRRASADAVFSITPFDFEFPESEYPRALALLPRLPALAKLEADKAALEDVLTAKADALNGMAIFQAMTSAMPTASRVTPDYGEALGTLLAEDDTDPQATAFGLSGFSPAVLFAAAKRILRTEDFQPTIHRVLMAAQEVRREAIDAWRVTRRLLTLRREAESVIRMIEFTPSDDPDEVPF